jgi:hypothetical protein
LAKLESGELFDLAQDRVRFLSRTVIVDQQLVRVTHAASARSRQVGLDGRGAASART